jgi:DnaJ family protein C protein 1
LIPLKNADTNEIRKAYRKLSLMWHPDKNSEPNAENMFRRIVGIYDILRDEEKRKRYNEILEFGLPDWKQPIYYYRRVRKFNFIEILVTISVVIVIGHYFVMWAQYFEQKLCLVRFLIIFLHRLN